MGDYRIGQTILAQDGRQGIIRFIGTGSFAAGEWIGLELPDDSGKNDGSVKGERYFECPPGHGIFIRRQAVERILKQPAPSTAAKPTTKPENGAPLRPRPLSGITADQARKRQSLMGAGSTPGSRLSIRSSTKSPTKTAHSSASSAASTPRTGTPATTNRTSDSSAKSALSNSSRPSMAPPPITRPTSHASRPSIGGAPSKPVRTAAKTQPRQSLVGSTLAPRLKPSTPKGLPQSEDEISKEPTQSTAFIENEENLDEPEYGSPGNAENTDQAGLHRMAPDSTKMSGASPQVSQPSSRTATTSRSITNGNLDSRAAANRETESLKSKLRIIEKKRQEDREKLKALDSVQAEKDRYHNIIEALQKKLKTMQQEILDLREKFDDAEARAKQVDNQSGEHESEVELITLDKEMAEERAEAFHMELEALKSKHEELELEAEILREENRELGSVMSPEERASAGWLQIERERDRLREALVLLRDISQQDQSELKSQIRELQEDLGEAVPFKGKFQEATEMLAKSEATKKHLMEQLEAAESNEDVAMALEDEKEAHLNQIEQLKQKVQDLEEEIQVNDDLEVYHISAEKELQNQLDETEALLHEKQQQINEQDMALADREYTLTKFRDVVSHLQGDIDELRRSKDITELEAHDMSSKSRAMMDLNLQLQNSAAKTQMKTIDVELGRIKATESAQQLDIVRLFVPDSYNEEKNPILALLCVERIKSKATLVNGVLRDRMRDRPHITQDESLMTFEVMEKLGWIAACCERFVSFMNNCDVVAFSKLGNVVFEMEPVERTVDGWVEALRKDEMSKEGPSHLTRMIGILSDLAEKIFMESLENKTAELFANTTMVENYCDSAAGQLSIIVKSAQRRLGRPTDENEGSLNFDKKMDQFSTKARTIKYLAGKTIQSLEELRSRSMGLDEQASPIFEEAESLGKELCQILRQAGSALIDDIAKDEDDELLTYASIVDGLTRSVVSSLQAETDPKVGQTEDVFTILSSKLQKLHSMVEMMHLKAEDLSLYVEFEKTQAPWVKRAKEIKSQKIISPDIQEELSRLKTLVQEQLTTIADKDRQTEELNIKIELLESRRKETKMHSDALQKLGSEVKALRGANEQAERELEDAKATHRVLQQMHDDTSLELDTLRKSGAVPSGASLGTLDHTTLLELRADNSQLKTEIESLQAAVRWLKAEAYRASIPVSTAASLAREHAWLAPETLQLVKKRNVTQDKIKHEANDVFDRLLDVAAKAKPVVLKSATNVEIVESGGERRSRWRPMHDTPRYHILQQREELERWEGRRAEFVRSVKLANRRTLKKGLDMSWDTGYATVPLKKLAVDVADQVEIVGSSP